MNSRTATITVSTGSLTETVTVTQAAGSSDDITLLSPNSGTYNAGSNMPISWSSSGFTYVRIEYSLTGGSSWTYLTWANASAGSYSWTIPSNMNTSQFRIRVSDYFDGSVNDISNSNITITSGSSISLLSPNSGTYNAGSNMPISWSSSGFTYVRMEYSLTGGSSWTYLTWANASAGSYSWTIPSNMNTSQFRIRVSDYFDAAVNDISDNNITITNGGGGGGGSDAFYASLPYYTGFESGDFDQYWSDESTLASGRIMIDADNAPHSGNYQMTMDVSFSGTFNTNSSDLHLDLSGHNLVDLRFNMKDFSDETHNLDGIFFSDDGGATFVKVIDLDPESMVNNSWYSYLYYVEVLAANNGLDLTSNFVIRFQQYDNYAMTLDGLAFDEIEVVNPGTGILSERNPNEMGGSLLEGQATVYDSSTDEEEAEISFSGKVYPNPVSDQFTLEYNLPHADLVEIKIMDMNGHLVQVFNTENQSVGIQIHQYSLATNLKKGTYLLMIQTSTGLQHVEKLIVVE